MESQYHKPHQITIVKDVGIEGHWSYFDKPGGIGGLLQNHLLRILTFLAMNRPSNLEAKSIHNEKIKILKRFTHYQQRCDQTVRGQYTTGYLKGKEVPGYLEEEGTNTESTTENFVAVVDIDQLALGQRTVLPTYETDAIQTHRDCSQLQTTAAQYF